MPKQSPLNLDFTKIWPGGVDGFADASRKPTPPKPPKKPAKED